MTRLLVWHGIDAWRAEASEVDEGPDGLRATGVQLGVEPVAYRVDYELHVDAAWITRSLVVTSRGETWSRRLDLRHDGHGTWTCTTEADGGTGLAPPGGDVATLAGALDCDLAYSPLTNVMPVRRLGLHRGAGAADLRMAWVSVPDLGVHASRQQYEHIGPGDSVTIVGYTGEHRGFRGQLQVDRDGYVLDYPGLVRRVGYTPLTVQADEADA